VCGEVLLKRSLLCLWGTLAWSQVAMADCSKFSDIDDRYHCLAVEEENSGLCEPIRSADKKLVCQAELNRDMALCLKVGDATLRTKCGTLASQPDTRPPPEPVQPKPTSTPVSGGRGTQFMFDLNAPTDCASVPDKEQRALCQGLESRNEDFCRPLQHIDFRYLCTATLRKQDTYCRSIAEAGVREACQRMAK
jgi:hypothetical protein